MNKVLFSKKSDEWATPQGLFDMLNEYYNFIFDLACSKENCKTQNGFTIEDDSLNQSWVEITMNNSSGWLWLNPPYSKCKEFVEKAHQECLKGAKIVMLLPARTDTRWFHAFLYKKKYVNIEFIKGRLKFGDSKNSAPFPSMIITLNNTL